LSEHTEVPSEIVSRVRAISLALPEAREETAWVGTRWRVRTRTFAHVLLIDSGWPPAYARAAATDGPAYILMFRSAGPELGALRSSGLPFFAPPWRADEVGMFVDTNADRQEIRELLTESYRILAPRALRDAMNDEARRRPG
jgi:YjbR